MAAFRTGDTLVWIIGPTLDANGAAVTGGSFSAIVALKPDGTSFSPSYSEIGSGVYKATVTSTARGNWFLFSQATVSAVVYSDSGSINVDDDWAVTVPGSYASGTAGAAAGRIGVGIITVQSPVSTNGDISIVSGDDYLNADGRALSWSSATWPSLTGASITMKIRDANKTVLLTKTGTVATASSVRVDLTKTDTALFTSGAYRFDVKAALITSADIVTLVDGVCSVSTSGGA